MFRFVKYAVATVLVVAIGGFALLGSRLPSYVRTSARSVQQSVQDTVPIEFELRRARDMIEQILPELQGQVRTIAEEEVAISALKKDIAQSQTRLESERATLASLRNKMDFRQVSYEMNNREVSRNQLTEQIARRLNRFKQGDLALRSKEQLLEKRERGLSAALTALESMRHRKVELEQKVEMLAAQAHLINSSKIQSGVTIDGSELSEADELLSEIETRLAVAQRVLAHEEDIYEIELSDDIVDEEQVLLEFDQYFDKDTSDETKSTMVVKVDE